MTDTLTASALWADIEALRSQAPLVHNITNLVVMNFTANALLAAGASPVMAHAHEEVAAMAGIAQSLVLNIGTLEPYWVQSMQLALQTATQRGIPTVLDPVGAGATPYRNESIALLLATATPTVLRGNGSEIMSVAGQAVQTKGVDSSVAANDAVGCARSMAQRTGSVVCVSGATDHIFDRSRWARLNNGHAWMTRITGVGCASSALIGALCAVQPDAWRATVAAMALISVAGEIAAATAIAQQQGVGSMQMLLLDQLQLLDATRFAAQLRLELGD